MFCSLVIQLIPNTLVPKTSNTNRTNPKQNISQKADFLFAASFCFSFPPNLFPSSAAFVILDACTHVSFCIKIFSNSLRNIKNTSYRFQQSINTL